MGPEPGTRDLLFLSAESLDAVCRHAEAEYPRECCGILLGRVLPGEIRVEEVRPARNLHPEPGRHFQADPAAYLKASREGEPRGWRVLGLYHSHPEGPAGPGAADVSSCAEGEAMLIVPVSPGGAGSPTAWVRRGDEALGIPIRTGA